MKKNKVILFTTPIILILTLLISLLLAVSTGAVRIPIEDIIRIIFHGENTVNSIILLKIRLPRVLLSALIGAGLATVGGVMQGIFRNPLVDSYTLGMSSGAALGAVLSIITGVNISIWGISSTGLFAFLGAVGTLLLVYNLGVTKNKVSVNSLLLAGVAVSYFLASVISFLMMLNQNKIEHIVFWTMGSLALASWEKVFVSLVIILPGIGVLLYYSRELNIMALGEDSAHHLGIDIVLLKKILLITCSIMVGCIVSTGGTIGFLGLVAPHIIRLLCGSDNRRVLPYAALLGAILLVLSDTLGRILIQPVEIPVGIMTSIMGGPFFIYLLRRNKAVK